MSEPTQANIVAASALTTSDSVPVTGRNEACPCGSGKKYKRCHGVDAAPKVTPPKAAGPTLPGAGANPAFPAGLDPSQFDPQMMQQFASSLQRLPKGQLQRLQQLMQKAMSGKDVTKESEEFERTLPAEFQTLMRGFAQTQMSAMAGQAGGMPGMGGMSGMGGMQDVASTSANAASGGAGAGADEMTEEEARRIVEAAAAAGKISEDQAQDLLKAEPGQAAKPATKKKSFWGSKT